MHEVSPGVYEIGKLRLDKNTNTLALPAKVNMAEGQLEYLICTPQGSTHESLIVTEVSPGDIHFAMLLLGAKGAGLLTPAPGDAPPGQIDAEYLKHAPKLKGDNIAIVAKWTNAAGKEQTAALEDWLTMTDTNKAAPRGPWIYTGSMFAEEKFLAQLQGAIAAVVTNPAALINNPRKEANNDQIWVVNKKTVPPADTPLQLTIKLETAPEPKPK